MKKNQEEKKACTAEDNICNEADNNKNCIDCDSDSEVNAEETTTESKIDYEAKLNEKTKEAEEYLDMLRRTMADFDNFRKRTAKEKESIYDDGFIEGFKQLLPVLDNLERAIGYNEDANKDSLHEGVEMIVKIFKDTMEKMGIKEIAAMGETFNPNFHNAVMHIEDENYEENSIVEVLQKGYQYKDRIIRYSMVKVAN